MAESNRTDLQTVYSFILDNKYAILISFIIVFLLIFAMVALSGLNSIINNLGRTNLLIFAFTFVIK